MNPREKLVKQLEELRRIPGGTRMDITSQIGTV